MSELPLQQLVLSDFRRIEGTRVIPLDAPVVLIHGPNGTGKTSLLSALELALTGEIKSMRQQSERYIAHLPHMGQPYATLGVRVNLETHSGFDGSPITVGGSRIDGFAALSAEAARFFSERCYLDQSSLSRLLDIYQEKEGSSESALEKFVNELLGLEELDALRNGLVDAFDLRHLKKLVPSVVFVDRELKAAAEALRACSEERATIRADLGAALTDSRISIYELGLLRADEAEDSAVFQQLSELISLKPRSAMSRSWLITRQRELLTLGGRAQGLEERPSNHQLAEAKQAADAASAALKNWESQNRPWLEDWQASGLALGIGLDYDPRATLERNSRALQGELAQHAQTQKEIKATTEKLSAAKAHLAESSARLARAHEVSSALVEGLTLIQGAVELSSHCPVCDRDFSEVGESSLASHVAHKIASLTAHSQELVDLRTQRDLAATAAGDLEAALMRQNAQLLPDVKIRETNARSAAIDQLLEHVDDVVTAREARDVLGRRTLELLTEYENLEAAAVEHSHLISELERCADALELESDFASVPLTAAISKMTSSVDRRLAEHDLDTERYRSAERRRDRLASLLGRDRELTQRLADLAEEQETWKLRLAEVKRRQNVAKDVHEAATAARAEVVHQVFTESLNDVWRAVFTRLAPSEQFVPRFGVPNATKRSFDIELETTHASGETSGPPQMMLSAGNLNTAALSLFIALHLAVEPLVPCLVFDDPVQAMDEVHISQFAALMRLLAKQHGRQVVIAVHERELFDYLALELSPAFDGDQLLTIELGERSLDEDQGITRHRWTSDAAIAS